MERARWQENLGITWKSELNLVFPHGCGYVDPPHRCMLLENGVYVIADDSMTL